MSFLYSCKKESLKVAPTVTITEATNVTANSATVGSTITADGGSEVLSRGVCWNSSGNPTTSDNKTTDGKGLGSYTSSLTSLSPGTTYNLKSYATNAIGTAYSSQTTFKTLALLATLTTTDASTIASTSFSSGGNITNDGGAEVTARGVCWSTTQNPTIADSKTADGAGSGIFTSAITGLTPGTTYYIRSYSTNSIGTAYGNQVTAITLAILPTLTTTDLSSITSTSATSGGNITNDGGAAITARGVCWGLSQTPTTTNSKTTDGTGKGNFTSSITGLSANTTYHVRAYATNSLGTGYGEDITLTTTQFTYGSVSDVEGNTYKTVTIGNQIWMAENLKTTKYNDGTTIPLVTDSTVWKKLSTPGYCWYNNDATANKNIYGALYNWYTLNTGKLCPTGWHVPSDAEWTILKTYLGGETVAGGKLKETGTSHWLSPNTGATNESGFAAVPGGYRYFGGTFYDLGGFGYWWSTTESFSMEYSFTTIAYYLQMYYGYSGVSRSSFEKQRGFSVRCLRD
ncbi:MAG: fibrobacter succinogenes major paralogous domain-containing protein [Bacteroidetes bacterium]|nr:fibrobacter succinogenes major paralogous domain-containing protein [Bacteroidota bacterium]